MNEITSEKVSDNLFEAMDIIIGARLHELAYDKTIICTIEDASKKADGEYQVTDGSITFTAFSNVTTYTEDSKVQVIIPNGDWSAQKTIIGKYKEDDKPINYVSAKQKITKFNDEIQLETERGVKANGTTSSLIGLINKEIDINSNICDSFYVSASFKSLFSSFTMTSGEYGLLIKLFDENNESIQNYLLSSKSDMFGQVYSFIDWTEQNQAYAIPKDKRIKKIVVALYQDGNFKYMNSLGEQYQIENSMADNILVKDISIVFGIDSTSMQNNTVKIYNNSNSSQYQGEENTEKNIQLIWINRDADGNDIGFDGSVDKDKALTTQRDEGDNQNYYWIEWYADDTNGSAQIVDIKFNEGEELQSLTSINIDCIPSLTNTEVYAKVYRNGYSYTSNTLSFTNNTDKTHLSIDNVSISIENGDKAQDLYSFYGEDNQAINGENSIIRTVKMGWNWTRGVLSDDYWDGWTVEWSIPEGNGTMLAPGQIEKQERIDAEGNPIVDENNNIQYKNVYVSHKKTVVVFTTEKNEETGEEKVVSNLNEAITFSYKAKANYIESWKNNNILCKIYKTEEDEEGNIKKVNVKEAIKNVTFSSRGNAGTDYTLVIQKKPEYDFDGDFGQIDEDNFGASIEWFECLVYDQSGKQIDKFNYDNSPESFYFNENAFTSSYEGSKEYLTSENGYNVIQAEYKTTWADRPITLTASYPLIYQSEEPYYRAEVPIKIIYDSYGKLQNITEAGFTLKLYKYDNFEEQEVEYPADQVSWEIVPFKNGKVINANKWAPYLELQEIVDKTTGNKFKSWILYPSTLYDNNSDMVYYLKALVQPEDDDTIKPTLVWTSPLLITQYKYSSSVLNKWNGQTFIEDENGKPTGRIFSTSLISGQMDNRNQFTGVIIGSLEDLVEGTRADQTGIYGYKNGVQTYAFKDDGTAFIGSGSSRINLDGANGLLASASWLNENGKLKSEKDFLEAGKPGAYIDLDEGYFFFSGGPENYLKLDDNGKMIIKGSITADDGFIGNWRIVNEGLIYEQMNDYIGYVEYKVQLSSNYCFLSSQQLNEDGEIQSDQSLLLYQDGTIECGSIISSQTSYFTDMVVDRLTAPESIEAYSITSQSLDIITPENELIGSFISILDRENEMEDFQTFLGLTLLYEAYGVSEGSNHSINGLPMKLQWFQDYGGGFYYLIGIPASKEWQENNGWA